MLRLLQKLKQTFWIAKNYSDYRPVPIIKDLNVTDKERIENDSTNYAAKLSIVKALTSPVVYAYMEENDPEQILHLTQVVEKILNNHQRKLVQKDDYTKKEGKQPSDI
mgnify:CR=1 FL=1